MKANHQEDHRKLGNRIAYIRRERGLTQAQLAELIDVDPRQISRIERGNIGISFGRILSICGALQVTPAQLMNYESGLESPQE